MRVSSQIAERLNTLDLRKLGNEKKISKLGVDTGKYLVPPQKISLW